MTRSTLRRYTEAKRDWRSLRRKLKEARKHHAPTALIESKLKARVRELLEIEIGRAA